MNQPLTEEQQLGIVFERYEPDDVVIRLPFRDDLTNHDFDKGTRSSTVGMTVQYVGAAKRSDLLCHARTVRRRKELIFTGITGTDADGEVVAHAVQTYRIV